MQAFAMAQQQQQQQQQGRAFPRIAPLSEVLTADEVDRLLEDPEVRNRLLQHLPEEARSEDELRRTARTPQFRSALRTLTGALVSSNYNTIIANFGLDPSAGAEALARGDPVRAFLLALQAQTRAQESEAASKDANT